MILLWRSERYPYVTQRLAFNAGRSISAAWEEAQKIRRLLIKAGDYQSRDVRFLAFGIAGAWQAFAQEYKINISSERKVVDEAIKAIIRRIK